MSKHRLLVMILASATLAPLVSADQQDKDRETATLKERAKALSDIRAQGSPSFRLRATLKIIKDDGSVSEGMYTEYRVSSAQWRKEFVVGDFHRTEVVVGRKKWTLDTSSSEPQYLNDIPGLLDPMGKLSGTAKPEKLHDRTVNGFAMRCFSTKTSFGGAETCFDKTSGALILYVASMPTESKVDSTYSFTGYRQFGDRIVATSYENWIGQKIRAEGKLEELTFRPEFDATTFEPSAGSKLADYCPGRMQPPKITQQINAVAPKRGGQSATVLATIGTDGTPRDLKVLKPNDKDFDRAAIDAVRHAKFSPATCDGDPMESPFALRIDLH